MRISTFIIALLIVSSCNQSKNEESASSSKAKDNSKFVYDSNNKNSSSTLVDLTTLSPENPKNDWIEVRNISTISTTEGGEHILIFSLHNKSDYMLEDINMRLIAKDKSGVAVDYNEYEFFPEGILSGLSKRVNRRNPLDPYIAEPNGGEVEFKVLSFRKN